MALPLSPQLSLPQFVLVKSLKVRVWSSTCRLLAGCILWLLRADPKLGFVIGLEQDWFFWFVGQPLGDLRRNQKKHRLNVTLKSEKD